MQGLPLLSALLSVGFAINSRASIGVVGQGNTKEGRGMHVAKNSQKHLIAKF